MTLESGGTAAGQWLSRPEPAAVVNTGVLPGHDVPHAVAGDDHDDETTHHRPPTRWFL
jgi:hypothetical protein